MWSYIRCLGSDIPYVYNIHQFNKPMFTILIKQIVHPMDGCLLQTFMQNAPLLLNDK